MKSFSRLWLSVILIAFAVILFMVWATATDFFTYLAAPKAVKEALFIVGEEGNASLARVSLGSLRSISYEEFSFVEVARSRVNGRIFALLQERTTDLVDVYEIRKGEPFALTSDGVFKEGLSLSPDGALIAYATVGEPLDGNDSNWYDVRRHEIMLLNTTSGVATSFDRGAHPAFLDSETLFYTTTDGYQIRNITRPEESFLKDDSADRIIAAPTVSDAGYFAFRNVRDVDEFFVLKFASRHPLALQYHATLSAGEGTLRDLALHEDQAFFVAEGATETVLLLADVESSTVPIQLFAFPEKISIMRIVF